MPIADIAIPFNPNLVAGGSFSLSWHGLLSFVGVAAAIWMVGRAAIKENLDQDMVYNTAIFGIVGGIVGGVLSAPPPPPPPAEPVRVGGNIIAPTKTKNIDPVYPAVAQAARVSGVVILEAVIGPDGRVTNVNILRSVPLLDDAAVAAVRQWEYTPTLLNGVPVPVIMTVTVNFQLR